MAIYITGDTHGEIGRFLYRHSPTRKLTENDTLIVAGDFGFLFSGDKGEKKVLEKLAKSINYTLAFLDGNHENFDILNALPVSEWNGGKVHILAKSEAGKPKIVHLMRGEVFRIEDKSIFTFGGGNSIDKEMRVPGISWWEQEMPSKTEKENAWKNLEKYDFSVDYIISHAAPEETMNLFFPYHPDEKPLNDFLNQIRQRTKYKHWYFGHLHKEREIRVRNQTALYFKVKNIETNEELE